MPLPKYVYLHKSSDSVAANEDEITSIVEPNIVAVEVPSNFKAYREYDHHFWSEKITISWYYNNKVHGAAHFFTDEWLAGASDEMLAGSLTKSVYPKVIDSMDEQYQSSPVIRQVIMDDLVKQISEMLGAGVAEWKTLGHASPNSLSKSDTAAIFAKTDPYHKWADAAEQWKDFKNALYGINPSYASNNVSVASKSLPGVDAIVGYPCDCPRWDAKSSVWNIIQHLNDKHMWSRNKIADWIDELHDSGVINAEFEPWNEEDNEQDKREG